MDNIIVPGINSLRETLTDAIQEIRAMESVAKVPAIQELVLAKRDIESARMRLGLARTYVEGKDPFGNE